MTEMLQAADTPKARALLDTARALFLRHGIRRVSVEEVCQRAGVSKRTFYKYFRSRDELALRILDRLIAESRARLEAVIDADLPIEAKARAIVAIKAELAGETSAELYHELMTADTEPGQYARARQREWDARVRDFYLLAQARGEIRQDLDVDLLMLVLTRMRDLVDDPAMKRVEPDLGRLAEALMKLFFYGIVPRPEPAGPGSTAPAKGRRKP